MTDTLAADINRTGLHSLEVPDSFETGGPFVVELRNHGEATHVHLHLDDALSEVASLEAGNHYVETESRRRVDVDVAAGGRDQPVRGKLKIVTAYGAQTHYVDVTIDPARDTSGPVDVDPDLSKPGAGAAQGGDGRRIADPSSLSALPAVVLGGVALVFALGAVVVGNGGFVFGLLALVAGVLAAGYLMMRG